MLQKKKHNNYILVAAAKGTYCNNSAIQELFLGVDRSHCVGFLQQLLNVHLRKVLDPDGGPRLKYLGQVVWQIGVNALHPLEEFVYLEIFRTRLKGVIEDWALVFDTYHGQGATVFV